MSLSSLSMLSSLSSVESSFAEDQTGCSSNTGPPSDLKYNQKRWLVIGICLHDILSPVLRKYAESEINQLYTSLVVSNHINAQLYDSHLQSFPSGGNGYHLNYETINNNKASYGRQEKRYDYRVQNAVDFSKLFLQPNIAQYTAFDEACDSSASLGILINVNIFPALVQNYANTIRSDIRNPWAHCDFKQWDAGKYVNSIQLMVSLVKNLGLITSEENQITGDLHKWETTGLNFLSGTTIGLELVTEIRHRTRKLSKHIKDMANHSSETDTHIKDLLNVNKALKDTLDTIDGKMLNFEEAVKKVNNKAEINCARLEALVISGRGGIRGRQRGRGRGRIANVVENGRGRGTSISGRGGKGRGARTSFLDMGSNPKTTRHNRDNSTALQLTRIDPKIINLSNRPINEDEIKLLSKGFTFAPIQYSSIPELKSDIHNFSRRLRFEKNLGTEMTMIYNL
ncbi:unnamed protein product [Mytilus coruscus]|uniref:Uncharacterized protein n=1 Tax=Mytilus coruscus TaxID=42192 RepID=A0A6J8DFD0_MYTCO|nr:unnamed protein product [Mytilus coruscus]